jgi:hypothetical protein
VQAVPENCISLQHQVGLLPSTPSSIKSKWSGVR